MRGTRTKRHFEQSVLIKFCFRRMVIKDETFLRQKLNQNYCLIKLFEIMQIWTLFFFVCVSIHLVKFLSWYLNSAWDENLSQSVNWLQATIHIDFEKTTVRRRAFFHNKCQNNCQLSINENKTARIRAKPWKFRLPFNVYGAVITLTT